MEKLSQLVLMPLATEKLLEEFIELLMNLLQAEQAAALLLDSVTGELTAKAYKGFSSVAASTWCLRPGQGIAGRVLQHKKTYLYADFFQEAFQLEQSPDEPEADLYLPLVGRNESYGIITLGSAAKRLFTDKEVNLAVSLVGYLALAIENNRLTNHMSGLCLNYTKSLAKAIEARDYYTQMHSLGVMSYSVKLGAHLGLSQDKLGILHQGALLHDIGKIGIPDDILYREGKLTDSEWKTVQRHPEIGARILGAEEPLGLIVPLVLYHHERYDGKGYPQGLKGRQIPQEARIIAVADAFEAMTSDRPYRPSLPVETAVAELKQNAGTQFEPEIVEAFLEMLNKT
jgi:HD-GYP domain-containing protein (c-di-GMP phosphodiesterase class II)